MPRRRPFLDPPIPRLPLAVLTTLLIYSASLPAVAQPAPVPEGGEFAISDDDVETRRTPDLAPLPDGGFLVVWQGSLRAVGQRLDSAGQRVGDEFQVNATPNTEQGEAQVASREDGSFIVTWMTRVDGNKGISDAVQGRLFDSSGTAVGGDFVVTVAPNIYTQLISHDIATTTAGEFVVAVSSYYDNYHSSSSVDKLQFDADAKLLDSRTVDSTGQHELSVRLAKGRGGFVVVWHGRNTGIGYSKVEARRLDAGGDFLGFSIDLSPGFLFHQSTSADAVPLPSGEITVVWDSVDSNQSPLRDIYRRMVDTTGMPAAEGWTGLQSTAEGEPSSARIAADKDGHMLSVWQATGVAGEAGAGIRARALDPLGEPLAAEFAVNIATTGDQTAPEIALASDGRTLLVVWQSDEGSGEKIYGRRFIVAEVFVDGFESGDLDAWSTSVP